MKCSRIINEARYQSLKLYLESFNRIEEDWVKWMSNLVEIISELTNNKINDKPIITFYLYAESVLMGCKPNVISGRLFSANDSGRLLIGLMSKVESFDCLAIDEKRFFAWCIIASCYFELDDSSGLTMFSSIDNVISCYERYGNFYFETLDNLPEYDINEPLGSLKNPVTVVTPNDTMVYINQLQYNHNDPYHFWGSIDKVHMTGLYNEHNLVLYKIYVRHYNPSKSCVNRPVAQIHLYVNESGILISDEPPVVLSVSCYVNKGSQSYKELSFKSEVDFIELTRIGATFSEFSLQRTLSEQTWHDCGLKSPSEFGAFSSFLASRSDILKREFLLDEFPIISTGILVREFVDFYPNHLSVAEYFANVILGYQFAKLGKSDVQRQLIMQDLLKDYLYDNNTDVEIFMNHASKAGIDFKNDKQLLSGINGLMRYCYKEIKAFLKDHYRFIIINDLP